MKGHYVTRIKRSETNPEELLEKAVKLSLQESYKENAKDIECLLVQYYVNKNGLDWIDISEKPPQNVPGCANKNEISLAKRYFKDKEFFVTSIEVLFHECEHVATWNYNNEIANDLTKKPIFYADKNKTIYLTSPDENKSRNAGIKYTKLFIEKMQEIINKEEKYQTERNLKLLKNCKNKLAKKENLKNKEYQKALIKKENPKFKNKIKKCAEKSLNNLKRFKNKRHFYEKTIAKSKKIILDYLNSYEDKEFLQTVLDYCKDNEYLMIKSLLNTTSFSYDERDCDNMLFTFSNNYLKDMISGESLVKHSLLYYGEIPKTVEAHQVEGVEKIKERLKDFKFKGIPTKVVVLKGQGMRYKLNINGMPHFFKDKKQLYLEASKHINSCDLDKMTFAMAEQINNIFGKEVVSHNLKVKEEKQDKKEKIQVKEKEEEKEFE